MLLNSAFISLFLSTPSARRATYCIVGDLRDTAISIHALREEGDAKVTVEEIAATEFLSTPSARRATQSNSPVIYTLRDFYPRPPRGGRRLPSVSPPSVFPISIHALREEGDLVGTDDCQTHNISIHALREEGDIRSFELSVKLSDISIHALREEGDSIALTTLSSSTLFLSTPSARRATKRARHDRRLGIISIHALREEGDGMGHVVIAAAE